MDSHWMPVWSPPQTGPSHKGAKSIYQAMTGDARGLKRGRGRAFQPAQRAGQGLLPHSGQT